MAKLVLSSGGYDRRPVLPRRRAGHRRARRGQRHRGGRRQRGGRARDDLRRRATTTSSKATTRRGLSVNGTRCDAPHPAARRRDRARRVTACKLRRQQGVVADRPRAHDADPGPASSSVLDKAAGHEVTQDLARPSTRARARAFLRPRRVDRMVRTAAACMRSIASSRRSASRDAGVVVITRRPHGYYVTHVEGGEYAARERRVDRQGAASLCTPATSSRSPARSCASCSC